MIGKLLTTHMLICMFLAGCQYNDSVLYKKRWSNEWWAEVALVFIVALFGIEIFLMEKIWEWWIATRTFLQLKTYWMLMRGKLDHLDQERLDLLNDLHDKFLFDEYGHKRERLTLKQRHELFVIKLILKRQKSTA